MDPYIELENVFFGISYTWTTLTAIIACCYLLLRRANCFVPEITSPLRLRRSTAAYFASLALAHVSWFILYFSPHADNQFVGPILCELFDFTVVFLTTMATLLSMLQDRRRPLWPMRAVSAATAPSAMLLR